MEDYKRKERFIVNVIFLGLIALMVFFGCKYLLPVLAPFLVALVVTLMLQPLIRLVAKRQPRLRRVAAFAICTGFYLLCGYLLINFGVQLVQRAGNLIAQLPAMYEKQIVPALWMASDRIGAFVYSIDPRLAQELNDAFMDSLQNMRLYITEYSMKGVGILTNTLSVLPGLFIRVLITIIATFFMVADVDTLTGYALKLVPPSRRQTVSTAVVYVKNILLKYVKSYSLIFTITFLELSIGFTILGINRAFLIGLCVAIFDILPILGTGGILIPWAIIAALWGKGGLAFGLVFLYVFILVVRNILEPRIVGKQIGLHPLVTLICMFVGLKLFGIIGLFGIPIALSVVVNLDRNDVIHVFPRDEDDPDKPMLHL
ncbi:MAG: sporulation integral membrane protein YtvI [Peptococcaceae bacterium]|nr:sporulation integral membrane protein YtvI [Peptococcaceae bacterium]